jgi:hypothetical protein
VTRTDPLAVRFPGTTLTWSQCYSKSGGSLDCLTCHSPHRDAEKTPAFYDTRRLSDSIVVADHLEMAKNQNFAVCGIHAVKCSLYAERRLNVKVFSSIRRCLK